MSNSKKTKIIITDTAKRSYPISIERQLPAKWGQPPRCYWTPRMLAILSGELGPSFVERLRSVHLEKCQSDQKVRILYIEEVL